jgi:hypothetical protein
LLTDFVPEEEDYLVANTSSMNELEGQLLPSEPFLYTAPS